MHCFIVGSNLHHLWDKGILSLGGCVQHPEALQIGLLFAVPIDIFNHFPYNISKVGMYVYMNKCRAM